MADFSVLMSVYRRESPSHLDMCLESLENQTLLAAEVIIVKDGPLGPDLHLVLDAHSARLPIRAIQLPENRGTGAAVRIGVSECSHDLVARMDSDDINVSFRFEHQMRFLSNHPEIDVLGGQISEFMDQPGDSNCIRAVPIQHDAIAAFARRRNPINQMTVMFRKSAVLAAGNYRSWLGFEDYELWVRMLLNSSRFHNLDETLVFVRCGNGMHSRRGGWNYARREAALFWSFRNAGFLTTGAALRAIACRVPARLIPASLRTQVYNRLLRRHVRQPE